MDENHSKDHPHVIEKLNPVDSKELTGYFSGYNQNFVRIGPKKYFIHEQFGPHAAKIYNFQLRSDDTFVVTFPKSGTTLTQELVWLLCNNLDYEKAKSIFLNERFPFLELSFLTPSDLGTYPEEMLNVVMEALVPKALNEIEALPSPRYIKSHLPLSLLPPSLLDVTKVVYVTRDPRDVAVSFYHHHKLMNLITPDKEFKPFWKYFFTDNMFWAPYFEHLLEAWEKRNHPNMLFLLYEEIIKDMAGAIRQIADFLARTISDQELIGLVEHLHIDNFKKNKSVNMEIVQKCGFFNTEGSFIRKGSSGGWRKYFDDEMTAEAEEWIARNLRNTDFRFSHF